MKMTRKILALLLALAMLCTVAPFGIAAEEVTEDGPVTDGIVIPEEPVAEDAVTDAIGTQIPVIGEKLPLKPWVNPLYRGMIDESVLTPHQPQEEPDAYVQATFVNADNAGVTLRGNLKNRKETITIYVSDESYDYNVVLAKVLAKALEHTGKPTEGDYLNYHIGGMGGFYERNRVNSVYQYTFEMTFTYMTTIAQENDVAYAVSDRINKMNIRHKSDYEKIRAVYEYMCENIVYDYDHLEDPSYLLQFSAYAAIVNKKAVCQGYALLFYRFMLELNVDCRIITGIGGDAENYGPHAWNIVELDGLYYNMDSTWDAGNEEFLWFMNNSWNFIYHYRDEAYETMEFHTAYPMAAEDYDPNVEAVMDPYIYATMCGDNAVCLLDRTGNIVVTGTGAMYDYGTYSDTMPFWTYMWEPYITSVTIDEGITYVGAYSFCSLDNLASVTLSEGLKAIGAAAFSNNPNLTEIDLPETLTHIDQWGFCACCFATIDLPASLTTLGEGAFSANAYLTEIHIPKNITTWGPEVFSDCAALTSVTFEDGCAQLGEGIFKKCTALESIELPEGLTAVPDGAFEECTALADVKLPDGLLTIGDSAFSECTAISAIVFPDTLTEIRRKAFEWTSIAELYFPASLTTIGYNAFSSCANLTEVYIPETVTSLSGFGGCKNLKQVYLHNTGIVGSNAFSGCEKLSYIEIGETITGFGSNAFSNCDALTELIIPPTIHSIDSSFYDCDGLVTVYLNSTGYVGAYSFYSCDALKTFIIGENVTGIGGAALQRCAALEELTIPGSIREIGFLSNNPSLHTITFLGDAPKFNYYSFSGVTATVYYPGGNDTWTEDIMQDYSGHITWVSSCAHEYESVITLPTCTEEGYTTNTCTLCGKVEITDYVDALGHTPGEVQVENEVPATCTAKGSYDNVTYCTACGVECSRESVTVDELPHTPGEVRKENVQEPTCTEAGSYDNVICCTECGLELSRETITVEMLPHKYTSVVTEPTCEADGCTTHTCTVCGHTYTDAHTDALGHDYTYTLTAVPGKFRTGTLAGTCSRCGVTDTVELPKVSGADYVMEVILEPTEATEGLARYTWINTEYGTVTFQMTLPKLNSIIPGDVNGDKRVDAADAYLVALYRAGKAELDETRMEAADVNGDAVVDAVDAYYIVLYYTERIAAFPNQK